MDKRKYEIWQISVKGNKDIIKKQVELFIELLSKEETTVSDLKAMLDADMWIRKRLEFILSAEEEFKK